MHKNLKYFINNLNADRIQRRRIATILFVLSIFVTGGVFWQLRITGITLAGQACCGKSEHVHTDECIGERRLICGFAEDAEETRLVCGLAEHTHGDDCYMTERVLICENKDADHVHDDTLCYEERQVLTCTAQVHTHTDACYAPVPEEERHIHTDECYEIVYTCGLDEHTHTLACYSDPNADLETADDWEKTLPKKLSGKRSTDLLAVADSQLGYTESTDNYQLAEDGQTIKGYTRYGAWYGNPYGDWNAMFAGFCLYYAGIDGVPYNSGCHAWTVRLRDEGLLSSVADTSPAPGDLVFFDRDGDGKADRAAIVSKAEEDSLTVIEGDSGNAVASAEYSRSDLFAFVSFAEPDAPVEETTPTGTVPEETQEAGPTETEPAEPVLVRSELSVRFFEDEEYHTELDGAIEITVSGLLPEGAYAWAYPVNITIADKEVSWAFDLAVFTADGMRWDVQDAGLTVTMVLPQMLLLEDGRELGIYRYENGDAVRILSETDGRTLTFEADRPAIYAAAAPLEDTARAAQDLRNAADVGGTYALTEDTVITGATIEITKPFTLDLAGFTLTADTTAALFTIRSGGELTVADTHAPDESTDIIGPLIQNTTGTGYGRTAIQEDHTLTYYITESTVANRETGATSETVYAHTVTAAGAIKAENQPVVALNDGTLNLTGGMIYGGTNRALIISGGTVNMTGGYICGFTRSGDNGGAIQITNATLNLNGGVLAANTASNGGAVSAGNNARIVINGGIISGNTSTGAVANQRNGGGGIYCTGNAKITLQAGYLTNNSANSAEYFDGGGAVLLGGNASFTISGGYVTANKAQGGGGIGTSFQQSSTVTMSGGHVSANYSFAAEGGGITVEQSSIGNITGGYITNNVAKTTHWGGGGLFCATASTLNLKNVLITENDAAGFGGGIAGCPTGKVYLYIDSGYAIFDNRDMVAEDSPHYVGAGVKQEDHQLCDNPVFLGNGHKDYFCALRSSVLGQMLGNVPVNWEGSADYIPVIIGPDGVQTAERIMGLTAHPSEVDKVTARSQANLFINGNYSDTHGGGILCNGDLIIGTPSDIEENANMTVWASKQLLGSSGEKLGVEMDQFLFELLDENMNRITTARNDENGLVIFDHAFHYNAAGTHTFFVRELVDQKNVDTEISYDSTLYRITVTVSETSIDWPDKDHHKISRIIEKIVIEKSTDGKNFTPCLTLNPNTSNYRLELLGNNPGFVNLKTENTKVTVRKEWPDSIGADSVTVYLLQNGKEIDRQILSAANQWTYTWSDLPVRDDNGIVYSYEVREAPVPGYDASITWQPDGTNSGGAYWIPMENGEQLKIGEQYLIVNADGNQALYVSANHQNNGFDATDKKAVTQHTEPLQIGGATYTRWYDASAIDPRCIFTAQEREYGNQNKGIILKCNGASADTWLLVQDNNNNYLKSTSGAQYASAFTFANGILKGQDNYNWNPNNLRTVIYSDNKFNTVTGTDNAAKVYRQVFGGSGGGWIVTISNTPAPEKLYDVNIEKVDTLDPSKVLPGAQFNLLCGDDALRFTLSGGVYRCDPNGEFTELITDENGILQITGLPEGSYTLREVKAPDGYQLAGDRAFSLPDSDGNSVLTLVVQDMPFTYVLPETGGIGNLPFIVTGILLLCGAVLLAVKKRMRYA